MAVVELMLPCSGAEGKFNLSARPRGYSLRSHAEREPCSSFHAVLIAALLYLKARSPFRILGTSGVLQFPYKITEYHQTPLGLLSNVEAHRALGVPL